MFAAFEAALERYLELAERRRDLSRSLAETRAALEVSAARCERGEVFHGYETELELAGFILTLRDDETDISYDLCTVNRELQGAAVELLVRARDRCSDEGRAEMAEWLAARLSPPCEAKRAVSDESTPVSVGNSTESTAVCLLSVAMPAPESPVKAATSAVEPVSAAEPSSAVESASAVEPASEAKPAKVATGETRSSLTKVSAATLAKPVASEAKPSPAAKAAAKPTSSFWDKAKPAARGSAPEAPKTTGLFANPALLFRAALAAVPK